MCLCMLQWNWLYSHHYSVWLLECKSYNRIDVFTFPRCWSLSFVEAREANFTSGQFMDPEHQCYYYYSKPSKLHNIRRQICCYCHIIYMKVEDQFWAKLTFRKGTFAEAATFCRRSRYNSNEHWHFFSLHQNELRSKYSCNGKEIKIRITVIFQHYRHSMEMMKTCHKHAPRMPHSVSIKLMFTKHIRLIQWHRWQNLCCCLCTKSTWNVIGMMPVKGNPWFGRISFHCIN